MGHLKKIVQSYFSFTRGQRNALVILIIIIIILIMVPPFFRPSYTPQKNVDSLSNEYNQYINQLAPSLQNELDSLFFFDPNLATQKDWMRLGFSLKQTLSILKFIEKSEGIKDKNDLKNIFVITEAQFLRIEPYIRFTHSYNGAGDKFPVARFPFDPNTVSDIELNELGFSQKLIATLQNFRLHGGKFRKPDDLKRLYGMPEPLYNDLQSYIQIKKDSVDLQINLPVVDFNLADSAELESLKGIGPELASRIIKYRSFLGGFYSQDQLFEIPGITAQNLSLFENQIRMDSVLVRKIDLNKVEMKELNKHPYLRYDDCKAILTYRRIMKKFKTVDELLKNKLIPEESYKKIKPYLVVE